MRAHISNFGITMLYGYEIPDDRLAFEVNYHCPVGSKVACIGPDRDIVKIGVVTAPAQEMDGIGNWGIEVDGETAWWGLLSVMPASRVFKAINEYYHELVNYHFHDHLWNKKKIAELEEENRKLKEQLNGQKS